MEEPQFLASVGISVSSAQRNMRRDLQRYGMDVPPDGLMQSAAVLLMDAYDAIPDPPVSPAAPLSSAVSARAPADGVDRISLLPDSLIRNVVSRLPAKDAARTAALATRWRGLWRSVPLALVDAHILPACVPADSIMPRGEDVLLRRRRRGVPRPGGAPRPLPLRPPLPLPHGVAPGRHRALAGDPRRQGRPRAHLSQPPVADRPPSPPRALRLHLRHPPAPRLLQGPQHRRAPAHHTLPPLPRACPRNFRHPGTRPPLPDRPEPRPGGPHHGLRCVQVTMSEVDITVVDAPRLERLLMWELISPVTPGPGGRWPRIKIGHAPNLCMLGHCQPRFELEIGNTILKVGTKMSPSTMVPSVKILALEVGFEVHNEVKMMPRFLKCFPNVERLHVFCKVLQKDLAAQAAGHAIETLRADKKDLIDSLREVERDRNDAWKERDTIQGSLAALQTSHADLEAELLSSKQVAETLQSDLEADHGAFDRLRAAAHDLCDAWDVAPVEETDDPSVAPVVRLGHLDTAVKDRVRGALHHGVKQTMAIICSGFTYPMDSVGTGFVEDENLTYDENVARVERLIAEAEEPGRRLAEALESEILPEEDAGAGGDDIEGGGDDGGRDGGDGDAA